MNGFFTFFLYAIMILGIVNVLRLGALSIGADIYDARRLFRAIPLKSRKPSIAIIIPAHNEEVCIERTVKSVMANTYARKRVVVVDDGSTDRTLALLKRLKKKEPLGNLTIVHQKNGGKATAINNALMNHVAGCSLVMVLDADSILEPTAISLMVAHFEDTRVVAAAANVKVIHGMQPLTIAQRIEYVISHRMKRALTTYNMEYIIGGVGSTFRKNIVQKVNYFDTDTMTEDIDFTVKIINKQGNKKNRIVFAADVIAYTEGVLKFKSLIRQRFRWKYGRMQTFYKNRNLFFSKDRRHTKLLTWTYLPFTLFSEVLLLIDPALIIAVLALAVMSGGVFGFALVYLITTAFFVINILADDSEQFREKMRLMTVMPFAYFLIIIMSFVDFLALLQSIAKIRGISSGISTGHWQHVERIGKNISL